MQLALGFRNVVFNRYRPAFDDYEVVLVLGSDDARDVLLGTSSSRTAWEERLFRAEDEVLPGVYFGLAESAPRWDDIAPYYVNQEPPPEEGPEHWHPNDSLLVRVDTNDGEPLGVYSIDEPRSGLRPVDDEFAVLAAVRSHASLALETARLVERSDRHRRELAHVVGTAARLTGAPTVADALEELSVAASAGFDFERVTLHRRVGLGTLDVVRVAGWWPDAATPALRRPLPVSEVLEALAGSSVLDGCHLLPTAELRRPETAAERDALRSRRNGVGPGAWHDQSLAVPMRDSAGALVGLLTLEDPVDRLVPSKERRQGLRLLTHVAQIAITTLQERDDLDHLARHDGLTMLRNRRGLPDFIAMHARPAVLLFGVDRFRGVNERLGSEVGDLVLQCLAGVLREEAGEDDVAVRLGGDEFCLITSAPARALALSKQGDRMRRAFASAMADLVPRLTVSVGIAYAAAGASPGPGDLLAAADRALAAAKARGRDATVTVDPVR